VQTNVNDCSSIQYSVPSVFNLITMANEDPQNGQMNIELSEEIAGGTYSNLAIITHSNSEFIVDFIQVMPGVPKARVKSRIVLTPQHAKRLMKALKENVSRFESANGPINDVEFSNAIPMNFGGTKGMA
jgi:Protein of unknown function (DUF3467)